MKILDVPQSGSVAGVTSSRNRFGQYRRTKASPVNPNTDRQSLVRARLSSLAANWKSITGEQRLAWDDLAAQLPLTDSLGQTVFLSGFQRYVGTNLYLLNATLAQISAAPALPDPTAAPVFALTANDEPALAVSYTGATVGERLSVFATGQYSAGRTYVSDFRWMAGSAFGAAAGSLDIEPAWSAKFGAFALGGAIAVRVDRANADGLLLSSTVIRGIVIGA